MEQQKCTVLVDEVTKQYGDFTAVDKISLSINGGRVFGFLGPNGAGKTTTIRMLVGITMPDSGKITMFGEPFSYAHQNRIGYLPEERGLYNKMKVCDQLRYFGALKGLSGQDLENRIDKWLDRMQMSAWKKKKKNDLSKGMQQKIQFIATVLHDPELLILDEPFSGLDPLNVEFLEDVIAETKASGKTIIFSTHLMETAEKLCDDLILINRSKKVLSGTLRSVKESYGKNIVALRTVGGDAVLKENPSIERILETADEKRLFLKDGAESQKILRDLIEAGAIVSKFELVEPSLDEIFKEKVREENE